MGCAQRTTIKNACIHDTSALFLLGENAEAQYVGVVGSQISGASSIHDRQITAPSTSKTSPPFKCRSHSEIRTSHGSFLEL